MKREGPKITVTQLAYHRNGICGNGFYAILFDDAEFGPMVATLFDEPGNCAVLQVPMLSEPDKGVAFGVNSWRGDHYEGLLREAVKTTESDGSLRVGPFAIPVERHPA